MVAFAWASNAIGTVVDARRVCELAHEAGALAWIDAVHYAAHEPIDVREVGADVLLCSPYKFCGPHLGMAYGRAEVMETLAALQGRARAHQPARPAVRDRHAPLRAARRVQRHDRLPGRPSAASRRSCRTSASLGQRFLDGISDAVTVYGLPGMDGRVPTFLVNVEGVPAEEVAGQLADAQIGVWAHDSWYSLNLYKRLGYADKSVRIGFIHYNTADEVDRLIAALEATRG